MHDTNTLFPGFDQKQLQWLEQKTAHLQGQEKINKQQELYRLALPKIQANRYQQERTQRKNQLFEQSMQSADPVEQQRAKFQLKIEDLVDMTKQRYPQIKYNLSSEEVYRGILKEAKAKGVSPQTLTAYLNGENEDFLYMMGFKQSPARQGGLKGLASSIAGDWGWAEWLNPIGNITAKIDDLVQQIPTLSEEEWDQFAREKLGGFGEGMGVLPGILTNTIPSLLKTATGTARGITNPFETAYGLGMLVGTEEGRGLLKDRYWDNLRQTAIEDPIGLASDFLTLISGGAGVVAQASHLANKGAKMANLSKTASQLGTVATKTGNFAKTAGGVADLGLDVLHNGMMRQLADAINQKSGLAKGGLKYLQYTQEPLKILGDLREGITKSLDSHLIDERTKKALENNPYIVKWRDKTKNYIDENGLSSESKKEINASHIQELGSEILELIEKRKESLTESGKGYEEIKNKNQIFDNSITESRLDYFLEEKGIKVEDGVLNFEDSTVVKDADMKAIQRAYDWIRRPEYDTKSGLAQRRKLDQLAYPDGKPSEGTKIIKGIRKIFDTTMKESIVGLKEVDDNFSEQIKALNEIQEGLVYKGGARKGEIKDNFNQIINTLDGPNRAIMAARLNHLRPGLLEEIQAVHHMKKLTDAYYRTPVMRKSMLAKGGGMILGGVGGAGHGPLGVVAGALAGFFAEKGLSKLSQSRVQKMIDGLGKEAKMKLKKIGGKLEADKELTEKEDRLMQEIAEKLQDQKNLPQEKGLGKLREGAETKYQLADNIIHEERNTGGTLKYRDGELRYSLETDDDGLEYMIIDNVEAKTQKQGIGTQLMKEAENIATKKGLDRIELGAFPQNDTITPEALVEFYEGLGYTVNDYYPFEGKTYYDMSKEVFKYQLADQTKSNNFKRWFGDWENDPKSASKVVNEKGEPLLMYHGSPEKFTIFDSEFMSLHGSSKGYGFYFSPDKNMAQGYGDLMQVYLDIKKPLSQDKLRITRSQMKKLILDVEKNIAEKWGSEDGTLLDNFGDTRRYGRDRVLEDAIDMLMENENDVDVFGELKNIGGDYDSVAKSFRKILGKDGIITPKEYIVFESNQIKSATDNIGTFDANNPDIRYQKHGVANPLEKNISAQRATQLENIRNGRSVQELADHYGIDIKTVEIITTPEGLKAYGKYGDGIITLAEKIKEGTAPHELFHATFDLVDSGRKSEILEAIMQEKKLDALNAEEFLADNFAEYFRSGRLIGEKVVGNVGRSLSSKLMQAVKAFYQKVKDWITGVSRNRGQVKKLFDEILDGEVDREMLGEILGNKKKVATDSRAQGAPSLQPPLSRFSIQITDKNSSFYKQKFDALKTKLKTDGLSAREFIDEIKLITKDKGNSGYMIKSKNGEKASIRISDHYANTQNNKNRGEFGNNTSIVIKIPSKKKSFFKADNEVNLIEYVYKPENLTLKKMENILDSFKEWIDTTEYNDKGYDLKHISTKASLQNGEVKYQRV